MWFGGSLLASLVSNDFYSCLTPVDVFSSRCSPTFTRPVTRKPNTMKLVQVFADVIKYSEALPRLARSDSCKCFFKTYPNGNILLYRIIETGFESLFLKSERFCAKPLLHQYCINT